MKQRCKFFTGYQSIVCEAGIEYRPLVGGLDFGWLTRLPCLSDGRQHDQVTCDKREFPTDEEVAESHHQMQEASRRFTQALADGICPHCTTKIEKKRQVGPCVYADPCGCRLYHGRVS